MRLWFGCPAGQQRLQLALEFTKRQGHREIGHGLTAGNRWPDRQCVAWRQAALGA